MARNIELKARLRDPAAARCTAERLATQYVGVERQIDTYFACPRGRLKLREVDGRGAQLVWYFRPDDAGPKGSDYRLVPVADAAALKEALSAAMGVRAVIDKTREIFLYRNVRIHLDDVVGLGRFLEFEAVLGPTIDDAAGHAQMDFLRAEFDIRAPDLLERSYGEMLGIAER